MQIGKCFAFDAESLVFGEVPVQHVHLHCGHTVQVSLYDIDRHEMPAGVDHQPAPREARTVFDLRGMKKVTEFVRV